MGGNFTQPLFPIFGKEADLEVAQQAEGMDPDLVEAAVLFAHHQAAPPRQVEEGVGGFFAG